MKNLTLKFRQFISIATIFTIAFCNTVSAQVSLPERNPLKLTFRGGAMSNNGDLAADLNLKNDGGLGYTVDMNYTAIGEAELSIDLLHFRGAGLGIQFSGIYGRPEFKATDASGNSQRVALTQLEIVRASVSFSFNGSDPYTMFELPYHSNKEAVLGVTGMIIRTEKTSLTPYATDSLGIKSISGEYSQALGVNFGWNWRLGQSGWVLGINGAVMFVINKSHLVNVETEATSLYSSGKLDFAPRMITAGLGYHF